MKVPAKRLVSAVMGFAMIISVAGVFRRQVHESSAPGGVAFAACSAAIIPVEQKAIGRRPAQEAW